jgi:uridine monophosphate synthetase
MVQHILIKQPYGVRAEKATHPLASYLLRLMDLKASNLCVSADVPTARELLSLADRVGPSIVVFKTHHDLVAGWDNNPQTGTGAMLGQLARKHGFLIFEDRKFGDIGSTVQMQYTGGSARIIEWAHMVNVNMISGKSSVSALADAAHRWRERYPYEVKTSVTVGTPRSESFDEHEDAGEDRPGVVPRSVPAASAGGLVDQPQSGLFRTPDGRKGSIVSITTVTQHFEPADSPRLSKSINEADEVVFPGIEEAPMDRGLLILAQMSTADCLMTPQYTQACVEAARAHPSFVVGFVCQENLNASPDDNFVSVTPGCQLPPEGEEGENGVSGGDGMGQQYNTPEKLIQTRGVDIVIVGRGILKAGDQQSEAERYRRRAWKAYLARIN